MTEHGTDTDEQEEDSDTNGERDRCLDCSRVTALSALMPGSHP